MYIQYISHKCSIVQHYTLVCINFVLKLDLYSKQNFVFERKKRDISIQMSCFCPLVLEQFVCKFSWIIRFLSASLYGRFHTKQADNKRNVCLMSVGKSDRQ